MAINTGKKSFIFYVYPDEDQKNILSYLESDNATAKGSFTLERINTAYNPFKKSTEAVKVSSKNKQVAAMTWNSTNGTEKSLLNGPWTQTLANESIQIRVYYVDSKTNDIREVCKTGDRKWEVGSLSAQGESFQIRAGTSISASVHADPNGREYELRVFAAQEGKVNVNRVPQISVFRYVVKGQSTPIVWKDSYITENITEY